ncbi:MAG: hypothetical protein HW383_12 [Candidatus Magasanikbacteria bacterium]|nr:hypothetical protein [Candidatus Magasanikbacteria bacterium]
MSFFKRLAQSIVNINSYRDSHKDQKSAWQYFLMFYLVVAFLMTSFFVIQGFRVFGQALRDFETNAPDFIARTEGEGCGQAAAAKADASKSATTEATVGAACKLVIEKLSMPYVYKKDDFVAVIDTTGKIANIPDDATLFVNADGFMYREPNRGNRSFSWAGAKKFETSKAQVVERVRSFRGVGGAVLALVFFVVIYVGIMVFRIIFIAFWSLIGLIVVKIRKQALSYSDLLANAIYALTTAEIAYLLERLTKWRIPFLFTVIFLIYFFLAIRKQGKIEGGE